jgi:hypothetical protein
VHVICVDVFDSMLCFQMWCGECILCIAFTWNVLSDVLQLVYIIHVVIIHCVLCDVISRVHVMSCTALLYV